MPIPPRLFERVDTFPHNLESCTDAEYKEARLREEFLNPLFEEFGRDMTNRAGHAEAYKDVVHEDPLKLSGVNATATDYSFRIGGTRKFFVEANEPDSQRRLKREITATNRAIDMLVSQLCKLTSEEIALVESATAPALAD